MTVRKRNTYLITMAVCAVALLIDRLFLSDSPSLASAEEEPGMRTDSASADASNSAAALTVPELPFPPGLTPLPVEASARDPFAPPPEAHRSEQRHTGNHAASPSGEAGAESFAQFATSHRLQGVMIAEPRPIAVVDGRWLTLGDVLGDCVLQSITPEQAVFHCADGEASLRLFPMPAP